MAGLERLSLSGNASSCGTAKSGQSGIILLSGNDTLEFS